MVFPEDDKPSRNPFKPTEPEWIHPSQNVRVDPSFYGSSPPIQPIQPAFNQRQVSKFLQKHTASNHATSAPPGDYGPFGPPARERTLAVLPPNPDKLDVTPAQQIRYANHVNVPVTGPRPMPRYERYAVPKPPVNPVYMGDGTITWKAEPWPTLSSILVISTDPSLPEQTSPGWVSRPQPIRVHFSVHQHLEASHRCAERTKHRVRQAIWKVQDEEAERERQFWNDRARVYNLVRAEVATFDWLWRYALRMSGYGALAFWFTCFVCGMAGIGVVRDRRSILYDE